MNRLCSLFLLLLVPAFANSDKDKAPWQGPEKPVYVVTQNHYAEGFGPDGQTARFSDLIAIEIYNPRPHPADQDAAYNVGERLSVFMGGQRRGHVRIEKVLPLQCDSSAAVLFAEPSVRLAKDTMALATNSSQIHPHENHQRQANAQEKELASELAMEEFRKHRLSQESAKHVKFEQALVTSVDQSEGTALIAYVYIETKNAIHGAFLIGRLDGSQAKAELVRYHKTTDLADGMDGQGYRFVDQLDLDGDGIDEIIVEVTGYESEEFRILKRVDGTWVQVHVGGQGGC